MDSISITEKVDEAWLGYIKTKKQEELERIIAEQKLNPTKTKTFVTNAFRDGVIPATGTTITKILPPVSRFSKNNNLTAKKQSVLDKLLPSMIEWHVIGFVNSIHFSMDH